MFQNRILLLAMMAAVAATGTAVAQPYPAYRVYPEPAPQYQLRVPPQEVAAIVRSMGLMPTSAPRPRGPFWVVEAVGRDGTPIRVRIDGMTGRVADIIRVPGQRLVRVYPEGPPPGAGYDGPPGGGYGPASPGAYGAPQPRGGQPTYYGDGDGDDDEEYPLRNGPNYGRQGNPNYYGSPRGSSQPPLSGPQVVTRDGVTNSIPQRQDLRNSHDPLLGVPREFRGEQKPKKEQKKTAAKPAEKTPSAAPLPKARPADAPTVAKNEAKPTPSAPAPSAPATASPAPETKTGTGKPDLSKSSAPPVQGLE